MRLRDVINAEKSVTNWGKWEAGGRMPRAAFNLSKPRGRSYRLGTYRWRVVEFAALEKQFRLLIAYHADKEQYRAVLALEHERDMSILAQYEFHGTHPGWHVLASCDEDIEDVPKGVMRFPGQRRLPAPRDYRRPAEFEAVDDNHALEIAAKKFRLRKDRSRLL